MATYNQEVLFRLGFPPAGATQPDDAVDHIVFATAYEKDDDGNVKKYVVDELTGELVDYDPSKHSKELVVLKPTDGWVRMYLEIDPDATESTGETEEP